MPKTKSISSEELIRLVDEYRFENPGIKVTIPSFGIYIRDKGYPIQDYTIRRDKGFREYLDDINLESDDAIYNDMVTYKHMDVDAFLHNNRSFAKLKKALIFRDQYYAKIAKNAVSAIKRKKDIEKEMIFLKEKIAKLEAELSQEHTKRAQDETIQKDSAIATLKKILDDYIYPDAANALLEREGILEVASKVIPEEIMEEKTIHADTDIKPSKFTSVNKLLEDF